MQQNSNKDKEGIYLYEVFSLVWNKKYKIILTTFIFSLSAVFYSLSLPNIYKSEAILAPATSSGSISSMSSQYAGLASIAGISVPTAEVDNVTASIEILKSLTFFENLMEEHNLFINFIAAEDWDIKSNTLIINPKIYNIDENKWVSESEFTLNGKPTMQFAHRKYMKDLSINKDKKTGIVNMSFDHYSPYFAKEFLEKAILEINQMLRNQEILRSEKQIIFLQQELNKTLLNDVRLGINALIQNQIENIALANASPEFVFKVLSAPAAPELKYKPSRTIICLLGFMIGLLSSSMFFILKYSSKISRFN